MSGENNMDVFTQSNLLFYVGVVLMSASAAGAVISLAVFRISGRKLRRKLEEEFGKKRR